MKHFNYTLLCAVALAVASNAIADDTVITLDLTKPSNPETLTFGDDGAWDKLYEGNGDYTQDFFESQVFIFSHMGISDWSYWEGFAPCTSTAMNDNGSYAVGCMAGGGIQLDDNGNVVTDDNGNVAVSASMPYIVGYYSTMMSADPSCQIFFNDGAAHQPVGVYVTNFPTAFYNCLYGGGSARAFTNGDKFTLTIHGVAADQSEKTIDVDLITYSNDMFQAIRGWKYVDLSSLGEVESIYFTMSSTDMGDWGMNTTASFCIDKLTVKANSTVGTTLADADKASITYDRSTKEVVLPQSEFAIIYNAAGQKVIATEAARISVASLDKGVYLVKTANSTLRFIK